MVVSFNFLDSCFQTLHANLHVVGGVDLDEQDPARWFPVAGAAGSARVGSANPGELVEGAHGHCAKRSFPL